MMFVKNDAHAAEIIERRFLNGYSVCAYSNYLKLTFKAEEVEAFQRAIALLRGGTGITNICSKCIHTDKRDDEEPCCDCIGTNDKVNHFQARETGK